MPNQAKWALSLLLGVGLVWVGWRISLVLVTLHVLVCFVLILVIMLQSGSAADLAGAFGGAGSQTAFGPRGAATLLSKATTWCAIVFMLTSLALWLKRGPGQGDTSGGASSVLEQTLKTKPASKAPPAANPPAPATPPAGGSAPAQNPPPAQPPKK